MYLEGVYSKRFGLQHMEFQCLNSGFLWEGIWVHVLDMDLILPFFVMFADEKHLFYSLIRSSVDHCA